MNSKALFNVISFLSLAVLLQEVINERSELLEANRSRKSRKIHEELSNDF